jgi:hypothetical protein
MLYSGCEISMNGHQDLTTLGASDSDQRTIQMHSIRYFLDVFASADPIMRAGAALVHGSVDWRGFPALSRDVDALQAQCAPPSPHPEDASSGHELAGL